VDGEIGRFEFVTYQVQEEAHTRYNTVGEVFPVLRCWEWYQTTGFKEIALIHGATEHSYHKTVTLINRVRHQTDGTPATTLRDSVAREGQKILRCLEQKTSDILERAGFDEAGRPITSEDAYHHEAVVISSQQMRQALETCDVSDAERVEMTTNPVLYEEPSVTVNISLDDVMVKKQKAERSCQPDEHSGAPRDEGMLASSTPDTRKYVHNTVAHLQHGGHAYTISGQGVLMVLRLLLGYLLNNQLLSYRLQFFVDGQKTLHAAIIHAFAWFTNLGLILDWYHLEDKCQRQLSLAMRGKAIRNAILETLTRYLWYGLVDSAITYLHSLPAEMIKDQEALRGLIGYLERNRLYLPCYAVRKQLGLRNSSNIGEKMNDLLVSERQKHNGMSWSPDGSIALAALTAIKRNHEYQGWFEYEDVEFKQVA
jgi:hypothetical protein